MAKNIRGFLENLSVNKKLKLMGGALEYFPKKISKA